MKTPFENSDFCREAFPLTADFRAAALSGMTRVVRRQRQVRRAGAVAAVALLATLSFLLIGKSPTTEPVLVKATPPTWFIQSARLPDSMFVHSAPGALELVHSDANPKLEIISDEQLIAFARDHKIGLIRTDRGLELLPLDSNQLQTQ